MSRPHAWLGEIVDSAHARALAEAALRPTGGVADGSRGSSSAVMAGALAAQTHRPVLLVVAHLDEADDAVDDLALFVTQLQHPVINDIVDAGLLCAALRLKFPAGTERVEHAGFVIGPAGSDRHPLVQH